MRVLESKTINEEGVTWGGASRKTLAIFSFLDPGHGRNVRAATVLQQHQRSQACVISDDAPGD
ncbi:hypothetical protein [Phaffia rhodozyma]|uniref:Uncharacterized protein n=1 Tax=Phaffia rhodozyma TaxID=264483 RepID=A0A0F7SSY6_PHARH|nr:hypothetical protein [Phaffia rhodozyma]